MPARVSVRAHQKSVAPARLTPSARKASQPFVASRAESAVIRRNPPMGASTAMTLSRRADARQSRPASRAAASRTSSLGSV